MSNSITHPRIAASSQSEFHLTLINPRPSPSPVKMGTLSSYFVFFFKKKCLARGRLLSHDISSSVLRVPRCRSDDKPKCPAVTLFALFGLNRPPASCSRRRSHGKRVHSSP
jgi:hypothetical protein